MEENNKCRLDFQVGLKGLRCCTLPIAPSLPLVFERARRRSSSPFSSLKIATVPHRPHDGRTDENEGPPAVHPDF